MSEAIEILRAILARGRTSTDMQGTASRRITPARCNKHRLPQVATSMRLGEDIRRRGAWLDNDGAQLPSAASGTMILS